jgi:hypothetical protein
LIIKNPFWMPFPGVWPTTMLFSCPVWEGPARPGWKVFYNLDIINFIFGILIHNYYIFDFWSFCKGDLYSVPSLEIDTFILPFPKMVYKLFFWQNSEQNWHVSGLSVNATLIWLAFASNFRFSYYFMFQRMFLNF